MPDCSDIQNLWDEAFDEDRAPARSVLQHLDECDDCRSYAATAVRTRELLQETPLAAVNEEADQMVIRALRTDWAPAAAVRRPVLTLVFAGGGSFALTMVVAGVMLSAASGTPEGPEVAAPSGVARTGLPETGAELDVWLESPGLVTGARSLRPAPAPEKRLPLRGQNRPRIHIG